MKFNGAIHMINLCVNLEWLIVREKWHFDFWAVGIQIGLINTSSIVSYTFRLVSRCQENLQESFNLFE